MSTPSGGPPPLRIGHDERTAACAALDAHLQAGRLDADEYGERYAQANLARTADELAALFVDLPAPHPAGAASRQSLPPAGGEPAREWRRYVPASGVGRVLAALVLVAAVSVLLPMAAAGALVWFVVIPMLSGGRRCYPSRRSSGYRHPSGRVWYG